MNERLKMSDFFDATMRTEGYTVIYDTARSPQLAHPPFCPSVQAEHFKEKVVQNKARSGGYYWVATMSEAREAFGAVPCSCS